MKQEEPEVSTRIIVDGGITLQSVCPACGRWYNVHTATKRKKLKKMQDFCDRVRPSCPGCWLGGQRSGT